jgi:molybdopterin synthase catalytic subunit
MKIEVQIVATPLKMEAVVVPGCGAVARFDGIVRGTENGAPIAALEYEAYQPMAERVARGILADLHGKHPFELARVHHRIGMIPVGEAAIILEVHAGHRGEAFAVLSEFMDRLKQDVPIWKVSAIKIESGCPVCPALP